MTPRTIRLDLVVGRMVYDANGARLGRLEEAAAGIVVTPDESYYEIREFHVGSYAGIERVAGALLVRQLLRVLGRRAVHHRIVVDARLMDFSDPEHLRVRATRQELEARAAT
jgi:hypothetical protein